MCLNQSSCNAYSRKIFCERHLYPLQAFRNKCKISSLYRYEHEVHIFKTNHGSEKFTIINAVKSIAMTQHLELSLMCIFLYYVPVERVIKACVHFNLI